MYKILLNISRASKIRVNDLQAEFNKLNILRFVLGLILLYRTGIIVYSGYFYFDNFKLIVFGCLFFLASFAFTIGLFTPIASLALLLGINLFDAAFHTRTLGTNVATLVLLHLFLLNIGETYSIDRILLNDSKRPFHKLVKRMYSIIGKPSAEQVVLVYFSCFVAYAVISFGAVLFHISDQFWVHGLTTEVLLTNAYLCQGYPFFREVLTHHYTLIHTISILSSIFQSIFQFLMLVLIFVPIGRLFVIAYSLLFFLFSVFFLQLSYLPYVELVFWLMVFYRPERRARLDILFDDYCNLCRKAVSILKFTDYANSLHFLPISKNKELLERNQIDARAVEEDIHGIDKGTVIKGFDLYFRVVKGNELLWIFYPLMLMGKWTQLGYKIYGWIAKNRLSIWGKCEVSFYVKEASSLAQSLPKTRPAFYRNFFIVWLLCLFLFVWRFPVVNSFRSPLTVASQTLKPYLYYLGLDIPFVFNANDLKVGNRWYLLFSERQGVRKLVPAFGKDGERLSYHRSDIVYFGNLLKFRRGMINADVDSSYSRTGFAYRLIHELAVYDYRKNGYQDTVKYVFIPYSNNSANCELPPRLRFKATKGKAGAIYLFQCRIIER